MRNAPARPATAEGVSISSSDDDTINNVSYFTDQRVPTQASALHRSAAAMQASIKLPPAIQVLRDEIRTLGRYLGEGLLDQSEADARLDEWGIVPAPGFYRFDRLALFGIWHDDLWAEDVLRHWEAKEQEPTKPSKKQYRTPQATIDASFYLVRLGEEKRLQDWLNARPRDKEYLLRLLKEKNARKTS
jgi:hypothetical protein